MKINTFTAILALLLAAIISYFLSTFQLGTNKLILGFGSFICLFFAAVVAIAVSFNYERINVLTRVSSSIFFFLFLGSQIVFANYSLSLPTYILINGSLLIIFLLIIYFLSKIE